MNDLYIISLNSKDLVAKLGWTLSQNRLFSNHLFLSLLKFRLKVGSLATLHDSTINSDKIVEFLRDMLKFIKSKLYERNKRLVLIMDNATIHKYRFTNELMKDKFNVILFFPLYTPSSHLWNTFSFNLKNNIWGHKMILIQI